MLPGVDPHNIKILLNTKLKSTHLDEYRTISSNLQGFRKEIIKENHWSGWTITSVELIRKMQIGNKKSRIIKEEYTKPENNNIQNQDTTRNQFIDIITINTPSTISDLEFDDYTLSLPLI